MYNEKPFYQQVCEQEPPMNDKRREKFAKLWDLITDNEIFKMGYDFLRKHGLFKKTMFLFTNLFEGKTEKEFDQFREEMFDFWFGTYSRCDENKNVEPLGSSGEENSSLFMFIFILFLMLFICLVCIPLCLCFQTFLMFCLVYCFSS